MAENDPQTLKLASWASLGPTCFRTTGTLHIQPPISNYLRLIFLFIVLYLRGSATFIEVPRFWVGKDLQQSAPEQLPRGGTVEMEKEIGQKHLNEDLANSQASDFAATGLRDGDIVAPRLEAPDPCVRCGQMFEVRRNTSTSCQLHMDAQGRLGVYKRTLISRDSRSRYVSKWTCCGQLSEFAQGCNKRAHVCKEIMLTVRSDADPAVCVDNLEVTVLNRLQISVFPNTKYDICVKITRELVNILHQYFSIKEDKSDVQDKTEEVSRLQETKKVDVAAAHPRQQSALYIKYFRLGDINVEVTTIGFPVNLKRYRAVVEPFVKHGKVMDWPQLIWKLEKHATWSVTKHTASSGISQMWKSMFPAATAAPITESRASGENQNVNEENLWNDDIEETKRGSTFLGIKPNNSFLV